MSKFELTRIIEARLCEILDMVADELKKSGKANFLPAGAVLSGGGVRLEGVVELAKKRLKLPVEIGRVREVKSDFSEFFNPDSATLAGLLLYQYENEQKGEASRMSVMEKKSPGEGFGAKMKEWLSDLIP